ncbi:MAG: prepilin-type N-terminal cleavage/methylation domain-containing protein [Comamonadaceae bacterium]|nr:prepilin-type N-terminal cleavage/methylation domain-containing protein [Comamonadaceae bacterium]
MLSAGLRKSQRGLSIVELMVGIAIGLLIVAASAMLVSGQLGDNRRLLLETQVQQDLRAASDIIVRELRRSGARVDAETGAVWTTEHVATCNRYATVTTGPDYVHFRYYRDANNNGPIGFKLENHVLRAAVHVSAGVAGTCEQSSEQPANWQDLTDGRTLKVTRFVVTPTVTSQQIPCAKLCPTPISPPGDPRSCWPRLEVRQYQIEIDGEAASDSAVKRSISAVVRLRNDHLRHHDPVAVAMCPA